MSPISSSGAGPAAAAPALPACPFLPVPTRNLSAASIRAVGADRGPAFYELALECAQALWLAGLPAQSLLLVNRAYGADLRGDEPVVVRWPIPYAATAWLMEHRREEQFIGNPRRHFQHLATRMVEPRKELRTWRAWACWRLACLIFPECPADGRQIAEEGVREPAEGEISAQLSLLGWPGEADTWLSQVRRLQAR